MSVSVESQHYKDAILDRLAAHANIAQFVSFGPGEDPAPRFVHIASGPRQPLTLDEAIVSLIASSAEASVNVRSFDPTQPRGHDFIYGLRDAAVAAAEVRRLARGGLFTIVNETIDIHDGGVSGVAAGDVLEFAPEDTPRAVEQPGVARLPRDLAVRVLSTVYGFEPDLDFPRHIRVEFSLHPRRRGTRATRTVIWEEEAIDDAEHLHVDLRWPNRFSQFLGDKVFGLLVADAIGLPVPAATVVARRVAPFRFGRPTKGGEMWIRTAPVVQVPGRFKTARGWSDPFQLLQDEDPDGTAIASVLAQDGVDAAYSGAAISTRDGVVVEGVTGFGDEFMQGKAAPEQLPQKIVDDVRVLHERTNSIVDSSRLEWAHDGEIVWILQLHTGLSPSSGLTIYPGTPTREQAFHVSDGLEPLRELVAAVAGTGEGIVLIGDVGITSHFGDVLRRAEIPSRLQPVSATTSAPTSERITDRAVRR
jgi:hypothetical protein